nr:cytochrome b5-related protein-like [Onthophagus taurus]
MIGKESQSFKDFFINLFNVIIQNNPFELLEKPKSTIGIKNYPNLRDHPLHSPEIWLEGKRKDDNLSGLWRIHNKLYDFNDFIKIHPGGKDWLELTEGTDITEAFESNHISTLPEAFLPKYFIKTINTPRNSPFTFEKNDLYQTLKKNVRNEINKSSELIKSLQNKTKLITDGLLLMFILTTSGCLLKESYLLGAISGLVLTLTSIAAHNFFHQKDNFRRFYFDLTTMSSRSWRISHALSHHLYTNTVYDFEISALEPFFQYLTMKKNITVRYLSWIYTPIVYGLLYLGYFIRMCIQNVLDKKLFNTESYLPFILWTFLSIITNQSIFVSIKMFVWVYLVSSFFVGVIGLNAGHHHPDVFHDGDYFESKSGIDWGLYQILAAMDRTETHKSHFWGLITFGDHIMHHLFPSLDHGALMFLYPTVEDTLKQFGIKLRTNSTFQVAKGQFLQLSKVSVQI